MERPEKPISQRSAWYIFHDEIHLSLRLVDVVNGDDIFVPEVAGEVSFAEEAFAR
jgi:hypothetical protein